MFFKSKNKKNRMKVESQTVYATQNGTVLPLEEIPDEVFSQKILGDGVGIIPASSRVYSPVNGTVSQVADTLHAFSIVAEDGAEVLIHIGVDTVRLKGKGFKVKVKSGDKVAVGDILCKVDLDYIRSQGLEIHTAIILVDGNGNSIKENNFGMAKAAETPLFTYSCPTESQITEN